MLLNILTYIGQSSTTEKCVCVCVHVHSVVSDSVWSSRRQSTRLPCPWDSQGKNNGVVCHFLLQCLKVKRESEVAHLSWVHSKLLHSCPTPCDTMDCSLPGSSVQGILQVRILEWAAIFSSRKSSPRRDQICISEVSCIGRQILYH